MTKHNTMMNGERLPIGDAAVVFLADALSRLRRLSDTESRILQRAITRETGAFRRWTEEDDAALMRMKGAGAKGVQIAQELKRSEYAIYHRFRELKARAGR